MRINLFQQFLAKTSVSKDYILLLYLLNAAVLMNFHKFIFSHPEVSLTFIIISVFALINKNYWRILFLNFSLGGLILIINFPRIGNHSTFLMVSIVVVFLLFLRKLFFQKSLSKNLLPYIFRVFLVIVYFYAGFHKLNTDFFNPCVSCVNQINESNISNFTFSNYKISNEFSIFLQYATIILEMVLPFGLLHYRTRKYTALILVGFHFYLIFAGFADFAAVVLFLITGSLINFNFQKFEFKQIRIYISFVILAIVSRFFMVKTGVNPDKLVFYQGIVFAVGWLYFVIKLMFSVKTTPTIYFKKYNCVLALMFIIISFWTLKTYIGLGNQGNLTMFSNLVTASKHNNHLLINTNKTRIFDFENDCVKFIDFMNPERKNDSFSGYYLPMVEFQYYIKHWDKKYKRPIKCVLEYQNKRYEIDNLATSQFNQGKWWYKYLSFRRIQEDSPNQCIW